MVEYSSEKFLTNANLDFDEMTYMYMEQVDISDQMFSNIRQ